MAITPMSADLNIISALNDEPNDITGLTASELKAKFDEAGLKIKSYINDTLLAGLAAENIAFTPSAGIPVSTDTQSAIENVQSQIVGIVLGQLPNGSVTAVKLAQAVKDDISSRAKVVRSDATVYASDFSVSAPYTCTVYVEGILETDTPHITRILAHDDTDEDIIAAWNLVTDIVSGEGTLTVYANAVPECDIPIQIEVVR